MNNLICDLSCIPVRHEPSDKSEMVSQVLFGETMELLDENEKWMMIKLHHDQYVGWVDKKQVVPFNLPSQSVSTAPTLMSLLDDQGSLHWVPAGALLHNLVGNKLTCGSRTYTLHEQNSLPALASDIRQVASQFLHAPYLWGGRTMFGMDCSGFTQIVFRLTGKSILRDAYQQAEQGQLVNFIEEATDGDLAFFDNTEGRITHVGIVLSEAGNKDKTIIHCSGRVRIDKLDAYGIFHSETGTYSHNLRLLRRL